MAEFYGTKNKRAHVVVEDQTEIPICPRCTFPNTPTARKCDNCGYPLQDNIRWVKAGHIRRCGNPYCDAFVSVTDKTCKRCGQDAHAIGNNTVKTIPAPEKPEQIFGKICPLCHAKNSAIADNCVLCGAELPLLPEALNQGDIQAAPNSDKLFVRCENVRTGKSSCLGMPLDSDLTIGVLGYLADQFDGASYVSREHFHLIRRPDGIFIKDTSSNGTYINSVRLIKGKEYNLASGTVLGLGDPSWDEHLAAFIKISY